MVDIAFEVCAEGRQSAYMGGVPLVFLLVVMCFFSADSYSTEVIANPPAEESALEQAAEPAEETGLVSSMLAPIDSSRDYLSDNLVDFTTRVDHFFGDERYFQEHNKSVVQLDLSESVGSGGVHVFAFGGRAKLDLPAAEKRFRFVIESTPEKKTTGDGKTDQPVTPKEAVASENYAASLRYEKTDETRWHFSSEAGAVFQFPLDPFVRTRASYALPLGEWRMKVAESLFWFSSIGLGETTQLDMEHVLSDPVLFRATSTATCYKTTQICDLRQDLSVYHTLTDRLALLYQASVIGINQPVVEETAYVLLMRYRYRMHKEWIFLEISPQLSFPRVDDFKLNTLLLLRLEFLFGGKQ
jgi:hypothetical protein